MTLTLSRSQLEKLLTLVLLGNWMVNSYRLPDDLSHEFDDVTHLVLKEANRAGFAGSDIQAWKVP